MPFVSQPLLLTSASASLAEISKTPVVGRSFPRIKVLTSRARSLAELTVLNESLSIRSGPSPTLGYFPTFKLSSTLTEQNLPKGRGARYPELTRISGQARTRRLWIWCWNEKVSILKSQLAHYLLGVTDICEQWRQLDILRSA